MGDSRGLIRAAVARLHVRPAGTGSPPAGIRAGGTRMFALVAALCVLALGSVSGCQPAPEPVREPGVPAGSLWLLAEAAEDGDQGTLLLYMDPEAVGAEFAATTVARLDGEEEDEPIESAPGTHGGAFTSGPMVKGFTEGYVQNLLASVKGGTAAAEGTLFGAILDGVDMEEEVLSEGEVLVSVLVPDTETPVRLRMVRSGDRWQLVAIHDTTDLYGLFF